MYVHMYVRMYVHMYVCQCSEVVEPSEDAEGAGSGGGPSAGAEVGGVRL